MQTNAKYQQNRMNGNNTERTDSVVVTTIADNLTDTSGGTPVTASQGDSTPLAPKLLNLGTPEATTPHPIYLNEKDESRPSSPSAVPGLGAVAPETVVTVVPAAGGPLAGNGAVPASVDGGNGTRHLIKHQLNEAQRVTALEHFETNDVKDAARTINRMGQRELQAKFKLVYGQPTHSNNNEWLRRKLCEAIGAVSMKPMNRARRRSSGPRKVRAKRHPTTVYDGLASKRVRVPSHKMRECLRERERDGKVSPLAHRDESPDTSIGTGIHIRLSKDGVYRSRSLPAKSAASGASRAVSPNCLYSTATYNGSSEEDTYPYADPYELIPSQNSLPIVFGHSNSTNDFTELVNRVDEEDQKRLMMTPGSLSLDEAPACGLLVDTDDVLLLDVDSAMFNAALFEAQGFV